MKSPQVQRLVQEHVTRAIQYTDDVARDIERQLNAVRDRLDKLECPANPLQPAPIDKAAEEAEKPAEPRTEKCACCGEPVTRHYWDCPITNPTVRIVKMGRKFVTQCLYCFATEGDHNDDCPQKDRKAAYEAERPGK